MVKQQKERDDFKFQCWQKGRRKKDVIEKCISIFPEVFGSLFYFHCKSSGDVCCDSSGEKMLPCIAELRGLDLRV